MSKLETKSGHLTAYAFACGYVERDGEVTITRENGVYFIRRSPRSLGGHNVRVSHTLKDARVIANAMRRHERECEAQIPSAWFDGYAQE